MLQGVVIVWSRQWQGFQQNYCCFRVFLKCHLCCRSNFLRVRSIFSKARVLGVLCQVVSADLEKDILCGGMLSSGDTCC